MVESLLFLVALFVEASASVEELNIQEHISSVMNPPDEIRLNHKITAYSPPSFPQGQLTATGNPVGPNVLAVGDRSLFNSWIVVGDPPVYSGCAWDTGHPSYITPNSIDIWLPDHQQAMRFGRQYHNIQIFRNNSRCTS